MLYATILHRKLADEEQEGVPVPTDYGDSGDTDDELLGQLAATLISDPAI